VNQILIPVIIGTGVILVLMMLGLVFALVSADRSQGKRLQRLEKDGLLHDPSKDKPLFPKMEKDNGQED
jgi:hypothetical protein